MILINKRDVQRRTDRFHLLRSLPPAPSKHQLKKPFTCTMSPSSTMEDLAVRPELLFKAPLNTMKLAPVTEEGERRCGPMGNG